MAAFFDDLPERMVRADLVVARAGASSVAELCAAGAAAILVPYPHAAGGHQMQNARSLERSGACRVVADEDAALRLPDEIIALARDPAQRASLALAARGRSTPEAARHIWESCRSLIGEREGERA